MTLNPLKLLAEVWGQSSGLDVHEAAFVSAMVVGADNESHKVRRSLEQLAGMAKISVRSASRMTHRQGVLQYIERIERSPRRVDIWLSPTPSHPQVARPTLTPSHPRPEVNESTPTPNPPTPTPSQAQGDSESSHLLRSTPPSTPTPSALGAWARHARPREDSLDEEYERLMSNP